MCNEDNKNTNNCMYEILKTILVLQKEANMPECCLDTCDKKCLGCTPCTCCCNTRPITIYTCGCCNTKLALPITKDPNETVTSSVFRIEKLDDNCATFRVLVATVNDGVTTYTATDSFFTINLNCVCVLKCLNDTYIECI
ncbi:spore coat protein [Clostridium sp. CAG:1193]|nr:spore coat protein [Clostridium sp. CAG:1193]